MPQRSATMRRIHHGIAAGGLLLGAAPAGAQVFSGGLPVGYTCVGTCATSGADGVVTLAPGGGTQFGYVTSRGVTGNPLGVATTTNGSLLRSTEFASDAGQELSFRFNFITSDGTTVTGGLFPDYAFVRLFNVADPGSPVTLFTARTIESGNTVPGFDLPGLAPGLILIPASTPIIGGAPAFAPLLSWSGRCYGVGCGYTDWLSASYAIPVAGTYQLEFGVFNARDELYDSALAFDFALGPGGTPTISPEPGTWLLIATGLGVLVPGVARRRRVARR